MQQHFRMPTVLSIYMPVLADSLPEELVTCTAHVAFLSWMKLWTLCSTVHASTRYILTWNLQNNKDLSWEILNEKGLGIQHNKIQLFAYYQQQLTLESWYTNLECQEPLNRCQQLPVPYKWLIQDLKQTQQTPTNNRQIKNNDRFKSLIFIGWVK